MEAIDQINQRLKSACVPVSVAQNGKYLILRATLPCKPGDGVGKKRYKLSPGVPANKAGLKRIEKLAHDLGDAIACNTFSWTDWQNPKREKPVDNTTAALIERFKADHLASGHCKEATWRNTWAETFNQLPQDEPLNEATILALVLTKSPDTRIRQLTCQRLSRLAAFAGLDIDLGIYQGCYSHKSLKPRKLPSDELIEQVRESIPNPQWQWVYGVIAAFGLRPHEAFFCEFVDADTLAVLKSKTDEHAAKTLNRDWVRNWNLQQIERPPVTGKTLRDYGQRVRSQFDRYKIPFMAYDLRHGYAIRGVRLSFNPPEMAKWMGHSETVHRETYRRWLDQETTERIYRERMDGFLNPPDA